MDADRWQRIRRLFEMALAQDKAARGAWLDGECAGDAELRGEIEALLQADSRADTASLDFDAIAPELAHALGKHEREQQELELVGKLFGPWRLLRELGRGGMGAVWLAQRDDGEYAQAAAVKLVHPGWDVDALLQRFRAERQILASLNHPNIARLLDGGVSTDGKPYLVLEFVEGRGIDEHCDRERLPLASRLGLFLEVCAAVAHAHRSLVVHRDLKPSNILVDTDGRVKLLDFGIAKLIEPGTQPGVSALRAFTPEYAAPEQVRGEPTTTGVDVYALGLLLYELLTGRRPYASAGSTPAAYEQAILTQEPERPSRAAALKDPEGVENARDRDLDPTRLAATLRGDLDAIVLKALRKDPADRYPSVAALAEDVRCFLERRPVGARRGDWRYRARRFLARHALASALGALVVLSLVGGLLLTLWQADIARQQRDAAERAEREARAVAKFLTEVFGAADPASTDGRDPPASALLAAGVESIAQATDLNGPTRSAMYYALGEAQLARGDGEQGLQLMSQALDTAAADPYARMRGLLGHGVALNQAGRLDESNRRYDEARAWAAGRPAVDRALREQLDYLYAVNLMSQNRKPEASALLRALHDGYQARGAQLEDPAIEATSMYVYLLGSMQQGDSALAISEALYRTARARPELSLARLKTITGVHAYALMSAKRMADAEPLFRETLSLDERIFGVGHVKTVTSLNNVAICLSRQERYDEAARLLEQAIAIRRAKLPSGHPDIAYSLVNAGNAYEKGAHFELARERFAEAIEIAHRKPPLLPWALRGMHGLARVLEKLGRESEALAVVEELLPLTADKPDFKGKSGEELKQLHERLQAQRSL